MTVLPVHGALGERSLVRAHRLRTTTVAAWFGLLVVFALSSLATERAGPTPTQRNWVFGRLDRTHTFGQTFVVMPGELIAMRVLLFGDPNDRGESVTLRLHSAEGDLPDLVVAALPLRRIGQRDWTTFEIPPLTLNLSTTLRLDIEAPTLPPNDWITVMAGPDTYPDGELFVDGTPRPTADLAFQPVYRHRWFDSILPITRLALGKPGLLGWPPLYALLAYGSLVVSAHALVALWRALRGVVDAH